ncbi:hypothetical protein AVEN_123749-1 [Araneus ventricosus]|uniref:Uncharacterized protein n=1 Tax=Araneus ventricosus TaxID=182803 RepID=A0A4Y2BJW6_ARAVE|nr:hypothetical protein AVEN_123749-1 [Araneus ventricosus]
MGWLPTNLHPLIIIQIQVSDDHSTPKPVVNVKNWSEWERYGAEVGANWTRCPSLHLDCRTVKAARVDTAGGRLGVAFFTLCTIIIRYERNGGPGFQEKEGGEDNYGMKLWYE